MPYVGNKCPDARNPEIVDPQTCYACACNNQDRRCNYPPFLIREIMDAKEEGEEDRYSPTALKGCHRQYALRRRYAYAIDPGKYWVLVRGNTIHRYVESSPPIEGHIREMRLEVPIDLGGTKVILTGVPDEYIPAQRHLLDYKTVKYISQYMVDVNNPKEEWASQLSCYRWMLHKKGVEIDTAEIVVVDPNQIKRVPYRLWSLQDTERYIYENLERLVAVYKHGAIPPVLPEDDQWRCLNCEVREACEQVAIDRDEFPPNPEDRTRKGR